MRLDRNKLISAGIVVLMVVVVYLIFGGGDAPKKAVEDIRKAVNEGDFATVEKHADLVNFYDKGFDAGVNSAMKVVKSASSRSAGELYLFKGMIVHSLAEQTKRFVEDKGFKFGPDGNLGPVDGEAHKVADAMGLAAWRIKSIGSSRKKGNTAIVPLKIHDDEVDKTLTFNISLTKTDDGVWRVQEIANAEEQMTIRGMAAMEKRESINAKISKDIEKAPPL